MTALLALAITPARAQDASVGPEPVTIVLDTGESLRGRLIARFEDSVLFQHDILGQLEIPRARITNISPESAQDLPLAEQVRPPGPSSPPRLDPQDEPQLPSPESPPRPQDVGPPEPAPAARRDLDRPPEPATWSGRLEFGLNGSQGNTDRLAGRTVAALQRKTRAELLDLSFSHVIRSNEDVVDQNELNARARQTWLFPDDPLGLFVESRVEFNEFRRYDALLRVTSGVTWEFINREEFRLLGRAGAGVSREFNSPDERWTPTANLALDLTRSFKGGHRFNLFAEFVPDIDRPEDFTAELRSSLELKLDETQSWRVRFGIVNRYDSDADPDQANDLDYFVTIVYEF